MEKVLRLKGTLTINECFLNGRLGVLEERILLGGALSPATVKVTPEIYTGEYIVTPKVNAQYLDTDNKLMTDDVTVLEIPYSEVSNQYGTTISIAS